MAKLFRHFEFDRAKIDVEKRTVPVVFSTETAVDRGNYDEILDHGAADMGRMADAPLLLNHDMRQQVGVVDSSAIDGKEGRAIVRFSKSALGEEIFNDVKDGIRKQASVGYERTKAISRTKLEGGRDAIRFAWAPFEISITPVGADPNAGLGRSEDLTQDPLNDIMKRNLLFAPDAAAGAGTTTVDRAAVTLEVETNLLKRFNEINAAAEAIGKQFPEAEKTFRELAQKAIGSGMTAEAFNAELLKSIPGIRKADMQTADIGMTEKDQKRYSILRGIQSVLETGKVGGFELDCHQEVAKRCKGLPYSGFLVPADVAVDLGAAGRGRSMANGYRDLNVTTAAQGGNFVQTSLAPLIEILRNRMVTNRLGVQTLSGLQGNIAIPRQSGAATAYTLAEAAVLTKSTQAINQISLSPHRVGAWNAYTKQLLLQSSTDVENFIRDDLMKVLAIKLDKLVLDGSGGADPIGILNTTGIGSVTFGAAATWAKLISFETALSVANADLGKMAYATTPTVRGVLKAAAKIGTTFPVFIWESTGNSDGPNDGVVNGYRAAVTNQIAGNAVYFGNWEDDIMAMWGGYDVVVDPYTSATSATVNITVNSFVDNAVRHAASFSVSTDSGAQ